MHARDVARLLAIFRVGVGAALTAAPGIAARPWLGSHVELGGTRVMARGLGIRDLVVGGIALHTLEHPQVGPRWVATGALCDAVDGLATLLERRDLPRVGGPAMAVAALGSATLGLLTARALRDEALSAAAGAPVAGDGPLQPVAAPSLQPARDMTS
jgi:hypothetical protein